MNHEITDDLKKSLALIERTMVTEETLSPSDVGYKRWASRTIAGLMQKVAQSNGFLKIALDEFEARFDREKSCDSHEIAEWYMSAAKYMESQGRKVNRVNEVQDWINKL